MSQKNQVNDNVKNENLEPYRKGAGDHLTTDQGVKILHFISEAFKHCKPIAATAEGVDLLQAAELKGVLLDGSFIQDEQGVIAVRKADASQIAKAFVQAIAQHRYWNCFQKVKVLA